MSALAAVAPCGVLAPRQASRQQTAARLGAPLAAPARQQRQQRCAAPSSRRCAASRRCLVVAEAAQAEVGKLISKVEIPAFIPRSDLMDQLTRWALIEVQEDGVANIGCPCKVTSYILDEQLWGFTVSFLKDGDSVADVRVAYDGGVTMKHEWVGRGADGFPVLEGNAEEVAGKNLEVRKMCDRQLSEPTRQCIRDFAQLLVASINKYYAFGSCFVDDST